MSAETNAEIPADELKVGDLLYDPAKYGTHGQRIEVQWTGHHSIRNRTYVAGIEELSHFPVQLAYGDEDEVKVFR
jgi:hypothetical protein